MLADQQVLFPLLLVMFWELELGDGTDFGPFPINGPQSPSLASLTKAPQFVGPPGGGRKRPSRSEPPKGTSRSEPLKEARFARCPRHAGVPPSLWNEGIVLS
ncbi:uncharacterized protein PGTG_00343 [Puccinia graminis f. sp. tritici CRL 75-36-700-3]|uniref:Secreted protein n=1 Tax=Puccinia graminis f. sp. tritici (strain CRL 75-36-700-3 / race SCCL) TaxID=418459 RepID=E3JQH0_PUCGT|nr:uncharacterized protein PGTG_00343 [Puccinia graminis f. sp. tritici CRL 75-36-700-3]EFP74387.1 hypothetical protein PGTG_00343 [Puccinia graminis f. sp. tritici CRL 75-36-700-3]